MRKDPEWILVKSKLIRRFGTVRAAARKFKCHHNSIRYSRNFRKMAEEAVQND